jgi:hypothetical protein
MVDFDEDGFSALLCAKLKGVNATATSSVATNNHIFLVISPPMLLFLIAEC